jgi:hypothetical protein
MKDMKRLKRRKDLYKKVRQRTKYWGYYSEWMKNTGTPCSCWMCSYGGYERTPNWKVQKEMWEEILDTIDLL